MKKLTISSVLIIFFLIGCDQYDEEIIDSSLETSTTSRSFTLSDDEAKDILLKKFGHTNFTMEEKSRLLAEHIVTDLIGFERNSNNDLSTSRVSQDPTAIICVTEIHDAFAQISYFHSSTGDPEGYPASLVKHCEPSTGGPRRYWVNAGVWAAYDGPPYYEELDYSATTANPVCEGENIRTIAMASWWGFLPEPAYTSVDIYCIGSCPEY